MAVEPMPECLERISCVTTHTCATRSHLTHTVADAHTCATVMLIHVSRNVHEKIRILLSFNRRLR